MRLETESGVVIETEEIVSVKVRERIQRIQGTPTLAYEVEVGLKNNGYIGVGTFKTKKQAESYAYKIKEV